MKILWMTWKDRTHALAGGAEIVNEAIARRLVRDGHEVTFLVAGYDRCVPEQTVDGFRIVRLGGRWTVYWRAMRYYRANLRGWADVVIDEMNVMPFFARTYVQEPNLLYVNNLCREVWFYQMPFPFSLLGYVLEPLWLRMLNSRPVITISESTKRGLLAFGFRPERVRIIRVGTESVAAGDAVGEPPADPVMLFVGSLRPMKRPMDAIAAFEYAKERIPRLKLAVIGGGPGRYADRCVRRMRVSRFAADIDYLGPVDDLAKTDVMRRAQVLCVPSVREGWGLVVTEAAQQGTPAVVYDVDGLRDSVRDGVTGVVCRRHTPMAMADAVVALLADASRYTALSEACRMQSRAMTAERMYDDFLDALRSSMSTI